MKTTKELLLGISPDEEQEQIERWVFAALRRLGFYGLYQDRLVSYNEAHLFRRQIGYLFVNFERHPHFEMNEVVATDNFVGINFQGYGDLANPARSITDAEIPKALETAIQAAEQTPIPLALRERGRRPDTHPEYEPFLQALDARWSELFR
jgi:hypothetical protein